MSKLSLTKNVILLTIIFMFTFNNQSKSNYDKIFFDFQIKDLDGETLDLSKYKNKAVLMVNVASNCGFTNQYGDLQALWENYQKYNLIVLGVPSNQFGGQEPGSNEDIKKFCKVNFNVNFPMTDKVNVIRDNAHPIYLWAKNYGKSAVPKWNFHKILINKEGKFTILTHHLPNQIQKKSHKP